VDPAAWVGRSLDGRYVVESVLGVGGMGTVLRAKHQFTGVPVAIKVLRQELASDPEVQSRFLAEAQAPNAINHPAIVKVLDAGRTADGILYMAMELLVGRSLRVAVTRRDLPPDQIKRVMNELLTALGHAHARGFVHRDLKPDNVFLCAPNDEVKLLDFGIAKVLDDARRTQAGTLLGTPAYMAPEQFADASNVDSRADLWAIGVMLYEMVTGRLPLAAATPNEMMMAVAGGQVTPIRAVLPSASTEVAQFFDRALARDPRRRFGAAIELALALSALSLPIASARVQAIGAPGVSGTVATAASGGTVASVAPASPPAYAPASSPAGVPAYVPAASSAPVTGVAAAPLPMAASPALVPAAAATHVPASAPPPAHVTSPPASGSRGALKAVLIGGALAIVGIAIGLVIASSGGSNKPVVATAADATHDPSPDKPRIDPPRATNPESSDPSKPVPTDPTKPDVAKPGPPKPAPDLTKPSPTNPTKPDPSKPTNPTKPDVAKPGPNPTKPDVVKPGPTNPAKPEPGIPATPDPKPTPPTNIVTAPDRTTCEARCSKARQCGTHLNNCVDDCLARPQMAECLRLGETSCADGALCGARLLCGGRGPQGNQSCGQVVLCQLGCASTFGGANNPQAFNCGCDCTTQLHPSQILTLGRINACVFRCNFDQTCINSSCGAQTAACQ
jgi:hypothetical protein